MAVSSRRRSGRAHVLAVFGTRPEAVKLAPVIQGLRADPDRFRTTVVATGQHRELLAQTLSALGLRPDLDLRLMQPDQALGAMLARTLGHLEPLVRDLRPDCVLVQGDTLTTLAAALAAFYRGVPCAHVEAGLRTYDLANPFPEEANRRLVSQLAAWHFAATPGAASNLRREGVAAARIFITGNPVVDAVRAVAAAGVREKPRDLALPAGRRRRVLVTAHRRESFGTPLREICEALREIAVRHPETEFLFLVHPNPHVAPRVRSSLRRRPDNLRLIPPQPYDVFIRLLAGSALAVTDSGGIQEEAPALGVRTVILRHATERPEALAAGGRLVPPRRQAVVRAVHRALRRTSAGRPLRCPFGDGRAAGRIVQALAFIHGLRRRRPGAFRFRTFSKSAVDRAEKTHQDSGSEA